MAHVIPQSTTGPRGAAEPGEDTYENTILLCPTHHTIIDKAPEKFPREKLLAWKKAHEERVGRPFRDGVFETKQDLCREVATLLIENKAIWSQWGPESLGAKTDPINNAAITWQLRKLDGIVPRNARIARLIENHKRFFPPAEYEICCKFIQHADAFERSAFDRLDVDAQPRFPPEFEDLVNKYV